MELRVLNYFLMVAREENITRAAQLLHVTQPTLSRQLMQLEQELGVKLFHRSSHSILLTDEGRLLKRRAQEILDLTERTKRDFVRTESLSGEIAIGSGEYKSTGFFADLLVSFHREHPLVRYALYSGNSDNIKERIESGALDLGLLFEPVDKRRYQFVRFPIRERWGVLARTDSPLAAQEAVAPQDLVGAPLIFSRRELVQNELNHWLGDCAGKIEIVASGNLSYNLAALAKSGLGPVMAIDMDCRYDGLTFIPLRPALQSTTVLVWKKPQTLSLATQAFLDHVHKCLKSIPRDVK